MTQYATMKTRYARLCEPFGYDFAVRKFGIGSINAVLEEFGTYRAGPRKGLNKGFIVWSKCETGGWVKTGPYSDYGASGRVEKPGIKWANIYKEWDDAMGAVDGTSCTEPVLAWSLATERFVASRIVSLEGEIPEQEEKIARLQADVDILVARDAEEFLIESFTELVEIEKDKLKTLKDEFERMLSA